MLTCVRGFLTAAIFVLLLAQGVWASAAKDVIDQGLTQVLSLIKDPGYADINKRQELQNQIIALVKNQFDFVEFSARTVGARWNSFTAAQQQNFSAAFSDLLINTYLNKIDGYNGEEISFVGEKTSAKGDRVEVMTILNMKTGKKIPVNYRLLPKDNTWKVYDVLVENISLVKNYRTQFQDILQTSTPEQLIERIRAKTAEVKQKNATR